MSKTTNQCQELYDKFYNNMIGLLNETKINTNLNQSDQYRLCYKVKQHFVLENNEISTHSFIKKLKEFDNNNPDQSFLDILDFNKLNLSIKKLGLCDLEYTSLWHYCILIDAKEFISYLISHYVIDEIYDSNKLSQIQLANSIGSNELADEFSLHIKHLDVLHDFDEHNGSNLNNYNIDECPNILFNPSHKFGNFYFEF